MSTPLFPLAVWQSGTNENSIPANDNALRVQVLMAPAIDVADSEPGSPSEDDIHVVGTPWGGFTTNNAVIYKGGAWLEWEAFEGWVKIIGGQQHYFDGTDWIIGGGDGIPDAPSDGKLYGRQDAAWAEVPSGGGQDTGYATINAQTGTAYTLVLADAGALVTMSNADANTLTVPPDSAVAFPVGNRVDIGQDGAGQTTVAAGSGVTIRTPETLKIRKRWGKATLIKRATDTWDLEGNLEEAQ